MDPRTSDLDFSALATVIAARNLQHLLVVMTTCLDTIAKRSPDPLGTHAAFAELDAAIAGAFQLSRDLLSAAGLQHAPDPVVLDLNTLLMRFRGVLQQLLGPRTRLAVTTPAETLLVQARPVQLEWMLLNLAANGRDAMPDGGGLHIETVAVDVPFGTDGSERPTPCVHLSVRDEGSGLPHVDRAQLFEPFFTTRPPAAGLGLTSVAVTVRELGGWLYMEGAPSGTTAHVVLPRYGTRPVPPRGDS